MANRRNRNRNRIGEVPRGGTVSTVARALAVARAELPDHLFDRSSPRALPVISAVDRVSPDRTPGVVDRRSIQPVTESRAGLSLDQSDERRRGGCAPRPVGRRSGDGSSRRFVPWCKE